MVAGGGGGAWDAGEEGVVVVVDVGATAVHGLSGTADDAAVGGDDGLVSEADAKDGKPSGGLPDEGLADSGFLWMAGAGGEDDGGGWVDEDRFRGESVVAYGPPFAAAEADIAR